MSGIATDVGSGPAGPTVSFGFNLAKVPDHGEDSDPVLRDGPDLGLAAVFDGMGGAGGTVYETPEGPRSGAYLAARIARAVVEEHLLTSLTPERALPGEATANRLHDDLQAALQAALTGLNAPVSRLRSRLLRALPTTMALGALQRSRGDGTGWICHVLWAGDSRVYALTGEGLQQLSVDDLRDPGDAMGNLEHDSVISNAISADTDFVIQYRQVALRVPFVLVTATDGCFGYVRSPMHFEELLLRTLTRASSDRAWSEGLQSEIAAVTGDDASMAAIAVGVGFEALQALLAPRAALLAQQYTRPMDDLGEQVARAERELTGLQQRRVADTADRWHRYRDGYEQLLRSDGGPRTDSTEAAPQRQVWNPPKPIDTGSVSPSGTDGPEPEPVEPDAPTAQEVDG